MKDLGLKLRSSGFTLIELLVVIAIIGILAAMLLPSLSSAKNTAKRIACAGQERQLAVALKVYVDDNDEQYPPRKLPAWMTSMHPYYANLKLLWCPSDVMTTNMANTRWFPLTEQDKAPRTYLINGWNDYFAATLSPSDYQSYKWSLKEDFTMPEAAIRFPTDTIIFGEKTEGSPHIFMDYDMLDDFEEVDQLKHGGRYRINEKGEPEAINGSSNYAFADGSVRPLKFGKAFSPVNMWATTDEWRAQGGE